MTLFELYNRSNISYYDIKYSAMDLFGNTDTKNECYKFLQEHFERGKKYELLITDLYPEYQQNGKHIHSVSLFLLGKELLPHFRKELNKALAGFLPHYDYWHDHGRDFWHTWFLTAMYQDYASCMEDVTPRINDSERHRSLAFHLGNHNIRYSIYSDYPYKTKNVPLRFSKKLIENYFYYRACSDACEHGIIAGQLFFDRYVKKFLEETRGQTFNELGGWNGCGVHWNTDMFMYTAYIVDAIICHNIWLGGPREEGTYKAYGLTPLLWHIHPENKLSIREYPLQFMLCLLDTIEPTKRFTGMRAYDILNKISIKEECEDSKGFDIVWNESLETDDGNNGNSFKQWYKGIENMQEWMNITCKQEENSIKIRWD